MAVKTTPAERVNEAIRAAAVRQACGFCGAKAGLPCKTKGGNALRSVHKAREEWIRRACSIAVREWSKFA